ncbi:MAG: sulfotransferase family protein [Thermoanaerobaculia bacterium]
MQAIDGPGAAGRGAERPAMPIIVGVPRSGTTLLRLMLDAHPELAIPPETGFLTALAALAARGEESREAVLRAISGSPCWPDFHLDPAALARELEGIEPFTAAEGARAFYRLYARRFGKARFGDKTPGYAGRLAAIESLLPEARFIHLIRDGRDVALSVRGLWFSPGDTLERIACDWRKRVRKARAQAARCRHYLEVRYEELVADTTSVLRRVCDFAELRFEPAMEAYHLRAPERLQEHEARLGEDGRPVITKEERLHNQRFTTRAPERSRVFRWRREMAPEERARFEGVAGDLLRELGYEAGE